MRRRVLRGALVLAAMLACSDGGISPQHTYNVLPKTGTPVGVGQDSTFDLTSAIVLLRDATDTVAGARFEFASSNTNVALVSSSGLITGVGGGTATITVSGYGAPLDVPVTVRGRPATSVQLNAHPMDTSSYWARPGHAPSSLLRMLVLAGTDTVFCNIPVCANATSRLNQRVVRIYSLDTVKAQVSNIAGSTRGQITAKDTGTVQFVLSVPGDGIADTVAIRFKLRPIDSLLLRVDSITDAVGTRAYTGTNVPKGATLLVGVGYFFKVPAAPAITATTISVNTLATVSALRTRFPTITWQSAVSDLAIVAGNGRTSGTRAQGTAPVCTATPVKVASEASDGVGYDPYLNRYPAGFVPPGAATSTGCTAVGVPTTLTPRGATCFRTGVTATDAQQANCTVYIKASMTDEVSGLPHSTYMAVIVRQP